MADVYQELGIMNDKLHYFGQDRWLNLILPSWDRAYRTAYAKIFQPKMSHTPIWTSVLSAVVGAQVLEVQVAFAPILWALSQISPVDDQTDLSTASSSIKDPQTFIADCQSQYATMLAACTKKILTLRDQASNISLEEFEKMRSRALLSPIWHPPGVPNVEQLTVRIGRTILAKLWQSRMERNDTKTPTDLYEAWGKFGVTPDVQQQIVGDSFAPWRNVEPAYAYVPAPPTYPDMDFGEYQRLLNVYFPDRFESFSRYNWLLLHFAAELARPDPFYIGFPWYVVDYLEKCAAARLTSTLAGTAGITISAGAFESAVFALIPYEYRDWRSAPM